MMHNNIEAERRAALTVAELMLAAARTTPKGCGADNSAAIIIDGKEKDELANQMRKFVS